MVKFTITINSVEAVQKFNRIAQRCEGEVDATSGHYVVDAKSIMGLFSLNLSKEISVLVYQESDAELVDKALSAQKIEYRKGG